MKRYVLSYLTSVGINQKAWGDASDQSKQPFLGLLEVKKVFARLAQANARMLVNQSSVLGSHIGL